MCLFPPLCEDTARSQEEVPQPPMLAPELGLAASRLVRNTVPWFLSSPVAGRWLQQPEPTKTMIRNQTEDDFKYYFKSM